MDGIRKIVVTGRVESGEDARGPARAPTPASAGSAIHNALTQARIEVVERLARAAEYRDDDTGQHQRRVGELAARLAAALCLPDDEVEEIRRAAPLHDVGKIGIPDAILLKPGPLLPDEEAVMRTHPVLGARILSGGSTSLLRTAERIARCHHERWDGDGYPAGIGGEDIPRCARIVAIVDVFDALNHDRPYRPAWAPDRVIEAISEGSGSRFDPTISARFLRLVG